MPIAPGAGEYTVAEDNLREMLADSPAFRTFVGAANQAEALDRIHLAGLDYATGEVHAKADLQAMRPYAIVGMDTADGLTVTRDASDDSFAASGRLTVLLEANVPNVDRGKIGEPYRDLMNTCDAIFKDLRSLSAEGSAIGALRLYFHEAQMRFAGRASRDVIATMGDFQQTWMTFAFGTGEEGAGAE